MSNFVAELMLDTKTAIAISASSLGAFAVEVLTKYDSFIVKSSAAVSLITLMIIATAKYCKMLNDNRASRELSRLNELEIEKRKLENMALKKQLTGDIDGFHGDTESD